MPARSHVRIVRRITPEQLSAEAVVRAQACLQAYSEYAWRWMIDAEGAQQRGEKHLEQLLDFLDFMRDEIPDDEL